MINFSYRAIKAEIAPTFLKLILCSGTLCVRVGFQFMLILDRYVWCEPCGSLRHTLINTQSTGYSVRYLLARVLVLTSMLQIRLTNLSTNVGIYMLPAKVIVCQVRMFYQIWRPKHYKFTKPGGGRQRQLCRILGNKIFVPSHSYISSHRVYKGTRKNHHEGRHRHFFTKLRP